MMVSRLAGSSGYGCFLLTALRQRLGCTGARAHGFEAAGDFLEEDHLDVDSVVEATCSCNLV